MRGFRVIWLAFLAGCATGRQATPGAFQTAPDTIAINHFASVLADDSLMGRGPWTPENRRAAILVATQLERLGARPVMGGSLLVPFVTTPRSHDTVYNVVGIIPDRHRQTDGALVGVTAHLDHLGIGKPDTHGDSIYNGFTDDAIGVAMALDVARRFHLAPADRPLLVAIFNLEEQGLLGSKAWLEQPGTASIVNRLQLLVGIDAGTPLGEPITWQLMGGAPEHSGTRLADSLARSRGWTTTTSVPRQISDVYPFAERGVPILFPIPGKPWIGYDEERLAQAVMESDHYHQPADQWRPDFPLTGTWYFADWVFDILHHAAKNARVLR